MNIALRRPRMTREEFFDWAVAQDRRYEFDGFEPVAMTGGTVNHGLICHNIYAALRARLRGSGCRPLGPDVGVATVGDTVRYPDALITCTRTPGADRLVAGVVVVFEVISPGDSRVDRIIKVQEYRAVASIHTYVIVEQNGIGLTVLRRQQDNTWMAETLTADDTLRLHAPDIAIPVAELYEGVDLPPLPGDAAEATA